jgi:hypothetical protein
VGRRFAARSSSDLFLIRAVVHRGTRALHERLTMCLPDPANLLNKRRLEATALLKPGNQESAHFSLFCAAGPANAACRLLTRAAVRHGGWELQECPRNFNSAFGSSRRAGRSDQPPRTSAPDRSCRWNAWKRTVTGRDRTVLRPASLGSGQPGQSADRADRPALHGRRERISGGRLGPFGT